MPITKYEGRTFTRQVFRLEECWFVNCVLKECTLYYSGGGYDFQNVTLQGCNWKFQEAANQTVQLLRTLKLMPSEPTPSTEIQVSGGGTVH